MGTPPDSLDPQLGYNNEAYESDFIVYTPLLTYPAEPAPTGDSLIPGLATSMPVVSDGGLTYTLQLRANLRYSDGTPVEASDFPYAIERALKLDFGGDSFYVDNIVGVAAYLNGNVTSISGITTDDATGQIVVHLLAPYGAFDNVLAMPSSAPIPSVTPMTAQSTTPPAGVGAYMFTSVKPQVGFTMSRNPYFADLHLPGIATGYVNRIDVTFETNNVTEAQDVLDNSADVFDYADTIPSALYSTISREASSRYKDETEATSYYFFLNTRIPPFNNETARQAVDLAVNRVSLERLAGGQLAPACYYLPTGIAGHVTGNCTQGVPATSLGSNADLAKAAAMIRSAGLAGESVTVWGDNESPYQAFSTYLNSVLNDIGFKSTLKIISGSVYYQTVQSEQTNAQAGYDYWTEDFPNPVDFYIILNATSIQPGDCLNNSFVDDPAIQNALNNLSPIPASELNSVASQWSSLDRYVAGKAYYITFGYPIAPLFVSDRVDVGKTVYQPVYGDDWSTFELLS